jgi:sporulation protein YlmC with PRC-barrel domain
MLLTSKDLINLPVYQKNGDFLGKIKEIELDASTHAIVRYFIKNSQVIKRLSVKELIIRSNQVVSLDNKKMIVEDGIVRDNQFVRESMAI